MLRLFLLKAGEGGEEESEKPWCISASMLSTCVSALKVESESGAPLDTELYVSGEEGG